MPRLRRFPLIRGRRLAQACFLVVVITAGVQFSLWARANSAGRPPILRRPPAVEGFLPISALMSLRLWLAGQGIHPVHPAGLAILVAVMAMSVLVAKSFCSHVCPIGTVSEALGRVGARLLGRCWQPPHWLDGPLRGLKYVLLAFFVWATWVALDLASVRGFLDSPYNRVADAKMLLFFARPSRLTVAVVGVLLVGSILVRDLWCRYLCPYGALLGLLGRLAPFKVTRDPATCTDCGRCTAVCPARLSVHAMTRVASAECPSCQDCVAACPVKGCLGVRPPLRSLRWSVRPALVVGLAVGIYFGVTTLFRLGGHWRSSVSEQEYAARLREIDSPLYTHTGGIVSAETGRSGAPLAGGRGAR